MAKGIGFGIKLGADEGMASFHGDYRGAVRLNQGGERILLTGARRWLVAALSTWLGNLTLPSTR